MTETISKDPEKRLEQMLGHRFRSGALLREALTHRSFVNECEDPDVRDNERFEFLGDAVIDLVVSTELMRRYPQSKEGPLSKFRASIVSEQALARVAERLQLGTALRLGRGEEMSGGRDKPSILSDAFEALMAAVYLDGGLEAATRTLLKWLEFPSETHLHRGDAKTELQQRVQAQRHVTPTYRLIGESGPDHNKVFIVQLLVEDEVMARGEGRSKKEAEQQAAARLLERMNREATAEEDELAGSLDGKAAEDL
ncbi:MAG: ribonuclease III [Myxococcota bacterium]